RQRSRRPRRTGTDSTRGRRAPKERLSGAHASAARRTREQPMGRIFETRKATMFARWDKMAKAFHRIGKEITIAIKAGGPNPDSNPQLRRVIQNARAVNMPKDKVDGAIKR